MALNRCEHCKILHLHKWLVARAKLFTIQDPITYGSLSKFNCNVVNSNEERQTIICREPQREAPDNTHSWTADGSGGRYSVRGEKARCMCEREGASQAAGATNKWVWLRLCVLCTSPMLGMEKWWAGRVKEVRSASIWHWLNTWPNCFWRVKHPTTRFTMYRL